MHGYIRDRENSAAPQQCTKRVTVSHKEIESAKHLFAIA
jgi:hypothetical protein